MSDVQSSSSAPPPGIPSGGGGGLAKNAVRRLAKELQAWRQDEARDEIGVERLGPVSDDLLRWEAVINGRGVGHGYDGTFSNSCSKLLSSTCPTHPRSARTLRILTRLSVPFTEGRWLLTIQLPTNYPLAPPEIHFVTPVIHANIALDTGEICLDLLKSAWTPAYTVLECVRAVRMLLAYPETDSPLNVDVAALLRSGDVLGTKALVECWCRGDEGRYAGQ
jgi:peroxin-4